MNTARWVCYAVVWSGLLGLGTGCASDPGDQQGAEETAPRSAAWSAVDAALREHGDLGVDGDFRAGLAELEETFDVIIQDEGDHWSVNLWPHSGEGHDFMFQVAKDTGAIGEVVIGVVAPLPDA